MLQVYQLNINMCCFGHPTLKPTTLVSNSEALDDVRIEGERKRTRPTDAVKTAVTYKNRDGKTCFKGSAALKGTQWLGLAQTRLMLKGI